MSAQVPVMLTCVLMLLTCTQISQQQVTFYNTCQDASAEGTLRVSIKEVDSQATLDASPNEYRAGLGLAGNTQSIGLQFDASTTAKLPAAEYFELESGPRTGSLTGREWFLRLKKPIDRDGTRPDSLDDNTVFEYTLQCTDLTINTAFFMLLRVQIIDVNDNSPVFQNSPYAVSVNELTPIGTTVFQNVTATDLDFDVNKNIVFDIVAGAGSDKFAIDPRSGYVRVKNTLDFETMNSAGNTNYVLSIQAMDSAEPPEVKRTATTTLNVTIRDGDDQKPIFVYPTCYSDSQNRCFNPTYTVSMVSGQSPDEISVFPYPPANPNVPVDILARDQDTLNYPVIYSVEQTEPRGYENRFQVTSEQVAGTSTYRGRLQLVQTIDRAVIQELRVIIRIQEDSTNRRFNRAILYLTVTAANNNPPSVSTFIGSQIGYIRENDLTGAYIKDQQLQNALQLVITDADIATGDPPQQYTFEVTPASPFYIDSNNFLRLTAGPLDYESVQQYTFNVIVREQSTAEQRSGSISLTVNVVDINDNTPFFVGTPYRRSLPEGDYTQGNGEFIVQVVAQDRDSVDTSITYQIQSVSDGGAGKFTISDTSGQLLLRAIVKVGEDYIIIVNATDSTIPRRSASVPVYVTITSSGNKDPRIPSPLYTVYVSEGIEVNREIFTIPATDPDNQALTFSIISGNIGNAFTINNNGVVSNRVTLDRETVPEYNLTITAADLGSSPASTVLRVIVTDVNDNSPVFIGSVNNRYFFNVQEGQTPPAAVGSVSAVDGDQRGTPQATVIYDMVGPNAFFRIDGQTGTITTLVPLDYETQQQHEFTVRAIDSGASPRANVVTVVVSVIDTQDSIPLFVTIDNEGSIQENVNGTSILTVSAVDADQTDNIVYQFAGGEFQSFSINPTTGVISTVIPLDYEVKNRYVFTVTTSDGVNTNAVSSTATVTISVIDQNDFTPVLTTSNGVDNISVLENLGISEELVDVNAADSDPPNTPNSRVTFSISNVVPPSGRQLFFINPTTGQLVLRNPFTDDPGVPTYTVTILGTNEGSPLRTGVLTLTVNVIRNTAPVFNPTTLQANIDENSINQVVSVTTATATDVDTVSPFNALSYTLRGDGPALDYFQIDSASGEIQTRALLSTTTDRSFTVRVVAQDGGSPPLSATALLYVTVMRNFQRPVWISAAYTIEIPEAAPVLENILRVTATDGDAKPPNNEVVYELVGDAVQLNYFEIVSSTGDIRPRRPLTSDPSRRSQFDFVVIARDKGNPSLSAASNASVTITVFRNNNAPRFRQDPYTITVLQGLGSDTVITVTAVDDDLSTEFNQITYSIEGPANALALFTIDSSGNIQATNPAAINSASETNYKIYVRAEDNGSPKLYDIALVELTINRNLNPPTFNSVTYEETILETRAIGDVILRVTASDADNLAPYNTVQYEVNNLLSSPPGRLYFTVDRNTGTVSLRCFLESDTSYTGVYTIVVDAVDGGGLQASQPARVEITVDRNATLQSDTNSTSPRASLCCQEPLQPYWGGSSKTYITCISYDYVQQCNLPSLLPNATMHNAFLLICVTIGFTCLSVMHQRFAMSIALYKDYRSSVISYGSRVFWWPVYRKLPLQLAPGQMHVMAAKPPPPRLTTLTCVLFVHIQLTTQVTPPPCNPADNRYAPVFINSVVQRTIPETLPMGSSIAGLSALDNDTLCNFGLLTYSIIGDGSAATYFRIEKDTGIVSLKSSLSNTSIVDFTVRIAAQDGSSPPWSSTGLLYLYIARNFQRPVWSSAMYAINIPETVPVLDIILRVTATDSDAKPPNNEVVYELVGDAVQLYYFEIVSSTGDIRLRRPLTSDPSRRSQFDFFVIARDKGNPPLTAESNASVKISVFRNNNAPRFIQDPYTITVSQDLGSDTVITVRAVDDDLSTEFNQITYSIEGPANALALFTIDLSGNIQATNPAAISSASETNYKIYVRAEDNGSPKLYDIALVELTINRNLNPPIFNPVTYEETILETRAIGDVVLRVTASDADNLSNVIYRLTGYSDSGDYFSVNPNNGQITVIKDITTDVSRRTTFYLQVEAEKQFTVNLQKAVANVTITVQRNINGPIFNETDSIYEVIIDETRALGSVVLQLYAPDADGDSVRYEVVNYQASETDFLYLEPFSGLIRVAKPLTSTSTRRFEFTVRARDGMNPERSSTASVIVNVRGDNQPPAFFDEPYLAQLNFSDPVGTRVFIAQGGDPDLIGQMNYELTGQYLSAPAFFRVDRTTGEIFLSSSISTESASAYILGLSTFDSARPNRRDFTNLTITINQNPNAPAFARFQYYMTISETYDLGMSIIQIEASDSDGHTLSYTVEAANPTGCDSYFLLGASGLIVTSRSLTTSTFPQCTMNVRIQDNGVPVRQSTGVATTIIIVDRNNNAPEFRGGPYTRTIPEAQNIGFTVFQFQATDADRPNTDFSRLEYSLIGDDSTGNFFEINSQTGVFTVRSQLDRNDISRYVARVVVKDRGSPSKSATVTGIVYIQRNLNGPVFNPTLYEATIFETHALRDSVVRVVATDADRPGPQSTLTFSLQDSSGNFASSFFRIDAASGNIFARLPLTQDLTHRNSFEFSVIATDQGVPAQTSVPPARVRVNIIRNLYSPVFQSEPYSARIDFTAPVNSPVTNVLATDADTVGPFSRVTYSLIGDGLATNLFTVTPDTGAIRTQNTLNSDNSEQYVLRVVAMDGGSPRLTDTSTVVVTVNRNLNAPQLQPQNYSVGILSTQALSIPILTINAADGDVAAPYNTVQYEVNNLLSSPPGRLYFTVDRNTGAVSLRCFLESDTSYTGVYTIVVDAVDGGGLKASPPARVEITVDRNTTLQSVNDTNSTSPRASLCCQEPLLPYWGGGSKTYISCISYDYWGSCLRFSGLCSIMQFTGSSLMLSTLSFKCVMIGFM
ncbi:protocadherin Fat 4-like [Haliotis asinina]|uniref:protocadherin Fat 4-like n=1 Tax=Haliotis asinina TaxID=109174 RepID=UPI003532348B